MPPFPVRVACEFMTNYTSKTEGDVGDAALLAAMQRASGVLYNVTQTEECLELPDDPNYDGIWDYQYCSELLPQVGRTSTLRKLRHRHFAADVHSHTGNVLHPRWAKGHVLGPADEHERYRCPLPRGFRIRTASRLDCHRVWRNGGSTASIEHSILKRTVRRNCSLHRFSCFVIRDGQRL